MLAVLFGVLAGALFGVFTLAVRAGLMRGADPEAGALVITGLGFLTGAALALPELASGIDPSDLWPFFVVGAIVPGVSQILFILAVRDAGPSRAAILIGTAPLISVLIALLVLDEPFRPLLLAGTALIVAGGASSRVSAPGPSFPNARRRARAHLRRAVRRSRQRRPLRRPGRDAPPLAASAASLLGASTVVLLYLLDRPPPRPTGEAARGRCPRSGRPASPSAWPTRASSRGSTAAASASSPRSMRRSRCGRYCSPRS